MLKSKQDFINKIHLIISVVIVVPVAFVYGFYPDSQFELFPKTLDEHNFYKAIMGLYLGFSALWILGILKPIYLKTAIITNIIFMLGLGCGRVLSLILDGQPTFGYVFGTAAELILGIYGIWVLKRFQT
ncbi:DUF4345 domain-containing protein [Psychroserpens jangbogonensis]|uniref:DUF4345 domain-containing protein n=1 Tax=Psychroserpens jangbogonensis TaxID=1484460 RepID=UPI00053E373A|nr:DUF4345 domain-containing protein [Psychroserpens jangbogonensis]